MPVQLDQITGISLGMTEAPKDALVALVRQSAEMASRLVVERPSLATRAFMMAITAAIQSVNALISATSARCELAAPPADIEVRTESGGGLVLRCFHSPAHEWKFDGSRTR
jgi:hypothetical protein